MKIFILTLLGALNGLTQALPDLKQLCLDKNLGDVISHPYDCRGYIVCDKEPSVHFCELGFHFDGQHKVCNLPENANCQLKPLPAEAVKATVKPQHSSLMAIDVATGEVIDPLTGYEPENIVCRHFGAYFLPNPKQCRSYYLCAYGHIHEHSCGEGTLWHYRSQQCVLNYKADCYQQTEEEVKEIQDSLASSNDNPLVVCYPVAGPYNSTTSSTLAYHPTTPQLTTAAPTRSSIRHSHTTAMRPTVAATTPSPPHTTHHSSKRPNSSNPYAIECPPKRQSYVAHPKDCGKYFICIMGTPVLTFCPFGLFWDSKKEYCDLPKNVKCFE